MGHIFLPVYHYPSYKMRWVGDHDLSSCGKVVVVVRDDNCRVPSNRVNLKGDMVYILDLADNQDDNVLVSAYHHHSLHCWV